MMERKVAWNKYTHFEDIFAFSEDYKDFLSTSKTERECVYYAVQDLKTKGYKDLDDIIQKNEKVVPGDKLYRQLMDKALIVFRIGEEDIRKGMNILGAHIDSPRMDLKQNPLYEDTGLAMLDTHYYGGLKKYQWVTLPLALHGVVVQKDGRKIDIAIGEEDTDPVFCVTDLLAHLSAKQMDKKASIVIEGEDLNLLVGSIPIKEEGEKEKVKAYVLQILKEKYGIEEEDFLSAEIEVVPAGKARDYGFDRSMVIGYGQDDRVCAYTSYRAMVDEENVTRTSCCLLVDKEEIGSVGATGMESRFFENTVTELLWAMGIDKMIMVQRTLANSFMLSSDVSAAYDPNYPSVNEMKNTAFLGKGMTFNKYTGARGKSGSNDANAEYMAALRKVMDENDISFQTCELGRVDEGGGGTIAYIAANYQMNVIDSGVAVLNMHSPWEISSKVDIYEAYQGYRAFLRDMK